MNVRSNGLECISNTKGFLKRFTQPRTNCGKYSIPKVSLFIFQKINCHVVNCLLYKRTVSSIHLTSLAAPQHPSSDSSISAAPIATTTPTDAMNMLLLISVLEKEREVHTHKPMASATAPPIWNAEIACYPQLRLFMIYCIRILNRDSKIIIS